MSAENLLSGILPQSQRPTIRGYRGVADYCRDNLGMPIITPRYVKEATIRGELVRHKVANHNFYSPADIAAWVKSLRRDANAGGGQ